MNAYIVRHGQVPKNVLGVYYSYDDDLTEEGVKQAEQLKEIISHIKFDAVISSPLLRATHTEYMLTNYDNEIVVDDRLRERYCGVLSNQLKDAINREEYWDYYNNNQDIISESIKDFFSRIFSFIDDLKTKNYENALIIAHSGVSKAFSAYFEGLQDGKFLHRGLKHNCDIKKYELK